MVDRSETLQKLADVKYYAWGVYDVEMSQNDTVTLGDFIATQNLSKTVLMKKSDGAELTCTVANNVVTCTGAATNALCVIFAFGVKA